MSNEEMYKEHLEPWKPEEGLTLIGCDIDGYFTSSYGLSIVRMHENSVELLEAVNVSLELDSYLMYLIDQED